jgi:hypothetical protein
MCKKLPLLGGVLSYQENVCLVRGILQFEGLILPANVPAWEPHNQTDLVAAQRTFPQELSSH